MNQKLGATTDARLVLGNIAKAADGDQGQNSLVNRTVLSLINIEEDKVAKVRENYRKTDTSVLYKNPPLYVNIYILLAANMNTYSDSLRMITLIMQFFQSNSFFTPLTHPSLDSRILQLHADLFSLNFEQINHIWSTLGGKYMPSVMYKVRQLTVEDEDAVATEGKLIETIITETSSIHR
ncbi:DUF4255 domain-containing protein [Pontibacter qinzhouensis]|uniref:DUF4255 domain-containing protein n=1 Tax=Pontibacter qinzhouensis TaxID=2603253 RepID=UPI00165006E0|nr:DUF4255 domain-containing protein [Pontibacter qinzhouensis]